MSLSPRDAVKLILDVTWRRRYLLVIPVLLMIPLAYLISQLAPRTYAARSLMLLVEQTNNPLNRDVLNMGGGPFRARIEGLKALLVSDRVLDHVMRDLLGPETPTDPRMQGLWKKFFAERLTLEPVGTDFLELQLKGGNPKGMGRQLEIVVSRFLDALLPGGASSATELLLAKRKEDLDNAQRAYRDFKARFEASTDARQMQRLRDANAQQEQRARELDQVVASIEQIRKALGPNAPSALTLDTEVVRAREKLAAAGQSGVDDASARQRLEQLVALQAAQSARNQLQNEVRAIGKSIEGLQRSQQSIADSEAQLQALERDVAEVKALHDSYVARYGGTIANRPSGLTFATPERIKLVDLPTDPTVPIGTLRAFLLFGFAASIGLGLGLALLAELLDPRVRRPQHISALTNLPVLARLP